MEERRHLNNAARRAGGGRRLRTAPRFSARVSQHGAVLPRSISPGRLLWACPSKQELAAGFDAKRLFGEWKHSANHPQCFAYPGRSAIQVSLTIMARDDAARAGVLVLLS